MQDSDYTAEQHPDPAPRTGSRRELDDVLRDQSIVVPQDAGVFALVGGSAFSASDPPHSDTPPCACRRCREGS